MDEVVALILIAASIVCFVVADLLVSFVWQAMGSNVLLRIAALSGALLLTVYFWCRRFRRRGPLWRLDGKISEADVARRYQALIARGNELLEADPVQALAAYQEALSLRGDRHDMAWRFGEIGDLFVERNQEDQAREWCGRARELVRGE